LVEWTVLLNVLLNWHNKKKNLNFQTSVFNWNMYLNYC
jgi:hypothetical protein